jgi:hypothetical protein
MGYQEYRIWFSDGSYDKQRVVLFALNHEEAIISAQARRIKRCLDYTVFSVELFNMLSGKYLPVKYL